MLRRNPFTPIAILAAFYAYFVTREAGRLIAGLALGFQAAPVMKYRIFLGFELQAGVVELTPRKTGLLILSGPGLTLVAGYALFLALIRWGNEIQPKLRLVLGLLCYLAIILDPIYYAIIPLFRLGGEPETLLQLLSISRPPIVAVAMALLILNTYLIQKKIVPLIRE